MCVGYPAPDDLARPSESVRAAAGSPAADHLDPDDASPWDGGRRRPRHPGRRSAGSVAAVLLAAHTGRRVHAATGNRRPHIPHDLDAELVLATPMDPRWRG